jgi:hypothetical protein
MAEQKQKLIRYDLRSRYRRFDMKMTILENISLNLDTVIIKKFVF